MAKLTERQERMLRRAVDGGWTVATYKDGPAAASLVKRGLLERRSFRIGGGYSITDAGRAALGMDNGR